MELFIGHVEYDCRMVRNDLKGAIGNLIDANSAAVGFNFRGLLNKIKEEVLWLIFQPELLIQKISTES